MKKGLAKLYNGDFNTMGQDIQADGSVIITLSSEHYPESYVFHVEDLYGESERVLEHNIIEPDDKAWLKARRKEAKDNPGGD